MKILIATDSMGIGGAETHVFTLINELRKTGNKITLISSGGVYEKILQKSGIRCVFAPLNKRDAISLRKCLRILKDEMHRVDIVHTHTRFTSFLAKAIRGKSSYPRIVATAHLNFPLFPFGAFAFWGDSTLAVSEDIRGYLDKSYGIKSEDVILTKNAVDISLYKKSKRERNVIIHTSRIDKGRALTSLLLADAARDILKKNKSWRIVIVGDGNLYKSLFKKARDTNEYLGFEGVILTGARSDIPTLLSYASIFIGVSRSAIEGMACGLPCILSGDEGYGGIVDNDNFDLLSRTNFCARGLEQATKDLIIKDLNTLILNKKLRNKLGDYARENIENSYKAQLMASDALICYERAFKHPSVCLMGFFGYQNLGDEETLSSAIHSLKNRGICEISVLCLDNKIYCNIPSDIKIYNRMSLKDISTAINNSDIFILCGGNLMQNETSMRSLLYYEQLIMLAKRRGKRVYMLSSGFGHINGKLAEILCSRGIKAADFCGCRTTFDLEKSLKHNEHSVIMPDFCFLLPEAQKTKGKAKEFIWILSSKENVTPDEICEIANARKLRPVAVNLFKSCDRESAINAKNHGIDVVTPKNYEHLSKILSNAEFSISERLHGSIFSIVAHTPTYIATCSEKNRALLNEISKRTVGAQIILPYSKTGVMDKKEIGACDSDFNYVIDSLKRDINNALNEIF